MPTAKRTPQPAPDLTRNEYIALQGQRCPYCMSIDTAWLHHNQVPGRLLALRHCQACDEQWTDEYLLCDFKPGDKVDP